MDELSNYQKQELDKILQKYELDICKPAKLKRMSQNEIERYQRSKINKKGIKVKDKEDNRKFIITFYAINDKGKSVRKRKYAYNKMNGDKIVEAINTKIHKLVTNPSRLNVKAFTLTIEKALENWQKEMEMENTLRESTIKERIYVNKELLTIYNEANTTSELDEDMMKKCRNAIWNRKNQHTRMLMSQNKRAQYYIDFTLFIKYLMQNNLCDTTILDNIKPIKVKQNEGIRYTFFTDEMVAKLIQKETKQINKLFILLLYCTGMRLAEASALCWKDLTLRSNAVDINIEKDFTSENGISDTKNDYSRRIITVTYQPLISALMEYKQQLQNKNMYKKEHHIFSNDGGLTPFRYKTINDHLRAWKDELGFDENITLHDMRASYITRAIEQGVNLEHIRLMTGHKDTIIISKHYSRYTAGKKQEVAILTEPKTQLII
ncbi:MAG: hypothetical protein EOM50_02970 [Erysipelotrichia bacterium]|nr:hypothetical protein [Erysipelotrichia bacterium]NCC54114.1 hypothetical protein [Erysipelotrichia bacterium]